MYVKATKQKAEPEIPADIPQTELNGVEAGPVAAVSAAIPPEPVVEPEPAPEAVAQAEAEAAKADEAKFALLRQIEAMKRAEQQQRERLEYQRIAAIRPLSRDEKLEQWKTQGLSAREALFLREHPAMIDNPEVASFAANEALAAGLEKDSGDYWRAIEEGFDKHMNRLRAQVEAVQPTPEFFRAPEPPAPRKTSAARFVSAPVSREPPSSEPRPVSPDRMATTLSIAEQEVARASGISLTEYARQKLKMQAQVRSGERQA